MISQPDPITNRFQIIGTSSPYYVVANYSAQSWTQVSIKLWVWKGGYEDAFGLPPTYTLRKSLVEGQTSLEIDISPYIKDTINPRCKPDQLSTLAYTSSDYSFVYYEVSYLRPISMFSDLLEVVHTTQSQLLMANLGWRYSFEPNTGSQTSDSSWMPNGDYNEDFSTEDSFDAYAKWYKFSNEVDLTNIAYTKRAYPITNTSAGVEYVNYQVLPEQKICAKESYGVFFIGKTGDWQFIPFYGKPQQQVSRSAQTYDRGFLNRYSGYNTRTTNSRIEINTTNRTTYTLNTGRIDLPLAVFAETILYSPRVLIYDYSTGISYPVKVTSNSFVRKNMYDDKNKYNVTMSFETDNNNVKKW